MPRIIIKITINLSREIRILLLLPKKKALISVMKIQKRNLWLFFLFIFLLFACKGKPEIKFRRIDNVTISPRSQKENTILQITHADLNVDKPHFFNLNQINY